MTEEGPAGADPAVVDPNDPLLLACRELSRQMDLFDDAAARTLRIGRNDLRALNLLEHGALSAATIADRLGLTRAAVTALIDRLEAGHLVTRTSAPGDRRVVLVGLQPATWTAFAKVYRPLGEHVHARTAGLPRDQQLALIAALTTLTTAFGQARDHLTHHLPTPP